MNRKKGILRQTASLLSKGWVQYLLALLIIGVTLLFCLSFREGSDYHLVSFILLFVVSLLSTYLGTGPVLLASTMSALAWDYFFIPPHNTFKIDRTDDILIFGLFFVIVVVFNFVTEYNVSSVPPVEPAKLQGFMPREVPGFKTTKVCFYFELK